jgi:hypothetical protein
LVTTLCAFIGLRDGEKIMPGAAVDEDRADHLIGAVHPVTIVVTAAGPVMGAAVTAAGDMDVMTEAAAAVVVTMTVVEMVTTIAEEVMAAVVADETIAADMAVAAAVVVEADMRIGGMDDHLLRLRTSVRCHWRIRTDRS